jgi:hypothetical protein
MSDSKGPIKDRNNDKKEQGAARNLSNRMYGNEEGDKKPAAAEGKNEGENTPEREGTVEGATRKTGISYEPDNDQSGAQGAYGQGNAVNTGTEGAQGYGKSDPANNEDMDYDGQFEDKKKDE